MITREEFLHKWAVNVLDRNDENDSLNDILADDETPMDERLDEVCTLVVRRVVLDILHDLGRPADGDIAVALSTLREMFVNSSPVKL